MLTRGIVVLVLAGSISAGAWAQESPKKPIDPIIDEVGKSLSPEGIQERQLKAIKALVDAYEREKARADAAEAKLKPPPDKGGKSQ